MLRLEDRHFHSPRKRFGLYFDIGADKTYDRESLSLPYCPNVNLASTAFITQRSKGNYAVGADQEGKCRERHGGFKCV